jgi:hypothetical protein
MNGLSGALAMDQFPSERVNESWSSTDRNPEARCLDEQVLANTRFQAAAPLKLLNFLRCDRETFHFRG